MAASNLTKTFANAGNRKKWTWSAWIKRSSGLGNQQCLLACSSGATTFHLVYFDGNDKLVHNYNQTYCNTDRVFRDTSGWYHLVCAVDTDQGTAANRVKMYVNGVQETLSGNFPSQGTDMTINNNVRHDISNGGANFNGQFYFDGYMTNINFTDGQQYAASDFGETDATTGIWKPKTSPSVTYGTNGFFLKMDNSGNMGLDSAGSNNFTTSGTIIQTKDTPSNVFATLNPLASINDTPTFSNTNNTIVVQNASAFGAQSTLGMSKGKYYAEFKMTASSDNDMAVGVNSDTNAPRTDLGPGFGTHSTAYRETGTLAVNGSDDISYGNSYAVNDIVGIAIDLDNNKLYFSKNGVFQNSGVPTSGSTGTGARSITAADSTESGFYFFNAGSHSNSQGGTWQANFGNGYFGTSAVASAQSPDDGNGIFEYDVPAGYRALCTKSINAQEYS
tara:strand:+ start:900 stop:2237 length:1338 start_codon:yes stop_codon:yes gene_type:complete